MPEGIRGFHVECGSWIVCSDRRYVSGTGVENKEMGCGGELFVLLFVDGQGGGGPMNRIKEGDCPVKERQRCVDLGRVSTQ